MPNISTAGISSTGSASQVIFGNCRIGTGVSTGKFLSRAVIAIWTIIIPAMMRPGTTPPRNR